MGKRKIRPLGDILLDLEPLLFELHENHDLQHGDVLNLIYGWQKVHMPGAAEVYTEDNSSPVFYYGPKKESL